MLKQILRIIMNKLLPSVDKRPLLLSVGGYGRMASLQGGADGLLRSLSRLYDVEAISAQLDEYFLIDRYVRAVRVLNLSAARELVEEGDVFPLALVRYWPTVPPHFSYADVDFAKEYGVRVLASFSVQGDEVHVLIGEANPERCVTARRAVAMKLMALMDKIAIGRISDAHPEEPDEVSIGGKAFIVYPHLESEESWRKGVREIYSSYLKAMKLPQYMVLRIP